MDEEHSLLIQAVNLFPGGTIGRWDKITAHFNEHTKQAPRSSKELTQESTKLKNTKEAVKVMDTNKIVKKHNDTVINDQPTQRFEDPAATSKPTANSKHAADKGKGADKGKTKEAEPAKAAPAAAAAAAAAPKEAATPKSEEPAKATPAAAAAPAKEAKGKEPAPAAAEDKDDSEGKPWSKEEQAALEEALKKFPTTEDNRWDKIAAAVGTRNKKQCMVRCKKLAQQIKDKMDVK